MSETMFKAAIRAPLPDVPQGKNAEYQHLSALFGPADDLDEYDGAVEYFHYDHDKHPYVPIHSYKGGWGVEKVLQCSRAYEATPVSVPIRDLAAVTGEMAAKFGVDPATVRLVAYSWYNGGDEPVRFD